MKQQTLAMAADPGAGFEQYRRPTKREVCLATMEQIVPWQELCAVIEPHYSRMGLAHRAVVSAAKVHDKHALPQLLHDNEQRVSGDSAYASRKALIEAKAPRAKDFTNQRVRKGGEIDEVQCAKNRNKSTVRARVEHAFAVVKRLWGCPRCATAGGRRTPRGRSWH